MMTKICDYKKLFLTILTILTMRLTCGGLFVELRGYRPTVSNLVSCAMRNNLEQVKELIEKGADPNTFDSNGSALQHMLLLGNQDGIDFLVKNKANPLICFSIAIRRKKIAFIKDYIIPRLLNINLVFTSFVPLVCAIESSSCKMVRFILDEGADPNFIPKREHCNDHVDGKTPLHHAILSSLFPENKKSVEIVKILLTAGADRNYQDKWNPLPVNMIAQILSSNDLLGLNRESFVAERLKEILDLFL